MWQRVWKIDKADSKFPQLLRGPSKNAKTLIFSAYFFKILEFHVTLARGEFCFPQLRRATTTTTLFLFLIVSAVIVSAKLFGPVRNPSPHRVRRVVVVVSKPPFVRPASVLENFFSAQNYFLFFASFKRLNDDDERLKVSFGPFQYFLLAFLPLVVALYKRGTLRRVLLTRNTLQQKSAKMAQISLSSPITLNAR